MELVRFREWLFAVDVAATVAAYAQCAAGGADTCPCEDCRNYAGYRASLPAEVAEFFDQLGIDYRKESEVWRAARTESGCHQYFGWYHFKGQMLEGWDCKQPSEHGLNLLDLRPITDTFSIGFTRAEAPTIFSDKNNLVQIEFAICIPWGLTTVVEPA